MSTLTALKFPGADGAQQAQDTLLDRQMQQLIAVQDAAIVTWPQGKTPKTEHLHCLGGQRELTGTFWGMLLGVIFFVPYFGPALGAAVDALGAKFNDYGIGDSFIEQTRASVTEGTSALFLLTGGTVEDKVVAALKDQTFEIIATNLPKAKEDALRAAFGAA